MGGKPRLPLARVGLVWLVAAALLLLVGARHVLNGEFPDPDDTLRMVQLRDLLGGQRWFDVVQHRIDPPEGVPMHWSRLVDGPLALVALALQPLLGAAVAQWATAIAVPLLTLASLFLSIGWMASRRFDAEIVGLACLSCLLLPATVAMFQPLRIDHHGWQIVSVAVACATLFARNRTRAAVLAGLSLAAGLTISLEVLPFTAAFAVVLALDGLQRPARDARLAPFMTALAGGLVLLFAATRGLAPQEWCDQISPAHLGFFAVAAVGSAVVAATGVRSRWAMLGLLALSGIVGLALFAWLSPTCLATPFGQLDPLVRHYWYENVAEGLPVWRQPLADAARNLPQLALAGLAIGLLHHHAEPNERRLWLEYGLLFAATTLSGLLVWRSIAMAGALAAVPLGWLLSRSLQSLRERRSEGKTHKAATLRIGLGLLVGSSALVVGAQAAIGRHSGHAAAAPVRESGCELRANAARLDRFAPATIFAPLDIGPSLIERTHHSVVATGHHRAQGAMRDVIAAFIGDEQQARAIVARHHAGLVVICTDLVEPEVYAADGPNGLMSDLLAGHAPDWLEPVDIGAPAPLKVWRVVS